MKRNLIKKLNSIKLNEKKQGTSNEKNWKKKRNEMKEKAERDNF